MVPLLGGEEEVGKPDFLCEGNLHTCVFQFPDLRFGYAEAAELIHEEPDFHALPCLFHEQVHETETEVIILDDIEKHMDR